MTLPPVELRPLSRPPAPPPWPPLPLHSLTPPPLALPLLATHRWRRSQVRPPWTVAQLSSVVAQLSSVAAQLSPDPPARCGAAAACTAARSCRGVAVRSAGTSCQDPSRRPKCRHARPPPPPRAAKPPRSPHGGRRACHQQADTASIGRCG